MSPPVVLLVEPRSTVREAVADALRREHGVDVAATADGAGSALLQAARVGADVVVVSAGLEESLTVFCERLRELESTPRVLVSDGEADHVALLRAIEAGVDGYVAGTSGTDGLAKAVVAIARGESVIPPAMLGPLLRSLIQRQREAAQAAERLVGLTPREREVLALLADGLDQRGIAAALVISPETARTHLQRLLRKLDVHSRQEAVELVHRTGLADRLDSIVERSAS